MQVVCAGWRWEVGGVESVGWSGPREVLGVEDLQVCEPREVELGGIVKGWAAGRWE